MPSPTGTIKTHSGCWTIPDVTEVTSTGSCCGRKWAGPPKKKRPVTVLKCWLTLCKQEGTIRGWTKSYHHEWKRSQQGWDILNPWLRWERAQVGIWEFVWCWQQSSKTKNLLTLFGTIFGKQFHGPKKKSVLMSYLFSLVAKWAWWRNKYQVPGTAWDVICFTSG